MNNKFLGLVFGGVLTFGCVASGCSDTDDTASATESALKGGKKAAASTDGGLDPCRTKEKKVKGDGGVKAAHLNGASDTDEDADEDSAADEDSDQDADEDSAADEDSDDENEALKKGPLDGGAGKGGGKKADVGDGNGKGGKDVVGDAGHGKGGEAKPVKDKGGKKCLEADGTVSDEDADEADASTHGKSDGAHGKSDEAHGKSDSEHGNGKNADAGT